MKSNKGWIKIHRELLDNPIVMKDGDHLAIWIWLLLHATSKRTSVLFGGKQKYLKPGELTTGRKTIAAELMISESKVQRVLSEFENEQQIEQRTDHQCRLISIVNWNEYQRSEQRVNNGFDKNTQKNKKSEQRVNNDMNNVNMVEEVVFSTDTSAPHSLSEQRYEPQVNNDRTTSEQRVNTKQEGENSKNRERVAQPPTLAEVSKYVQEQGYEMDPAAFFDYYEETGWTKKNGQAIRDWKASVRTWARREREFKKTGQYGNGSKPATIEPPKYKAFKKEPEVDAVQMPEEIRKKMKERGLA